MRYASEVIELLAAYPGRDFKMIEIIRYAANKRTMTVKQTRAMRKAVYRVLETLADSGNVLIRPPTAIRGGFAQYRWKE